jgi:hypothetical protein
MKVLKQGAKEELSSVLVEWFQDARYDYGKILDKNPEFLLALMKDILRNPNSYDMMIAFVRLYKTAVGKMDVQDVQDAVNLRHVKKVQSE